MRAELHNKDIMSLPDDIAAGCDMTYTDPPWGAGPLKMFETIMTKAGFRRPGNEIEAILARLFRLVPKNMPCFVEYGVKGHEMPVDIGVRAGHEFIKAIPATQLNGNPFVILQFNSEMDPPLNRSAWRVLNEAMGYHKPRKVFEPFAGHGLTAEQVLTRGASVVASEINPARFAKMQKRLRRYMV